jgi:hypothetical protein
LLEDRCPYSIVLDGRERDCIAREPGHVEHVFPRNQGRLRVEIVSVGNDAPAGCRLGDSSADAASKPSGVPGALSDTGHPTHLAGEGLTREGSRQSTPGATRDRLALISSSPASPPGPAASDALSPGSGGSS